MVHPMQPSVSLYLLNPLHRAPILLVQCQATNTSNSGSSSWWGRTSGRTSSRSNVQSTYNWWNRG